MSWCFWMMDGESNKETWTQRSELMFGQRKPVCFSSPLRRAGPTTVSPRSFHRPNLNTEMGRRDWVLSWHAALHPNAADWPAEWPRLICLREEKVSNLLLDAARKKNDSFEDTLAKPRVIVCEQKTGFSATLRIGSCSVLADNWIIAAPL